MSGIINRASLPAQPDATGWRVARQHFRTTRELGQAFTELRLDAAARYCAEGDSRHVAQARALVSKLSLNLDSHALRSERVIVGTRVNVGAALSGDPRAMWKRRRVQTDNAPVQIVTNLLPSGGITDAQQIARGAAIVALILKLRERRSVRLRIYADIGNHDSSIGSVASCDLDCATIDVSRLMALTATPDVTRGGMHSLTNALTGQYLGGWLRGHFPTHQAGTSYAGQAIPGATLAQQYRRRIGPYSEQLVRQDVGVSSNARDTLVIPALGYGDEIASDSVAWVNRQLAYFLGQADA